MSEKSPLIPEQLSRRERQVMDLLLASGEATASAIRDRMADGASYSAVRAVLRVLEEKKLIGHEYDGPRYVYRPVISRQQARKSALRQMLHTFYEDSCEELLATVLETQEVTSKELKRMARLIDKARERLR